MDIISVVVGLFLGILIYLAGYVHGRVSRITGECIAQIIDQAIEVLHDDEPEPPVARYRTLSTPSIATGINGSKRTL